MRPLALVLVFLVAAQISAQQQERNLIDRLLRPDMELKNSGQNKVFVTHSTEITKPNRVWPGVAAQHREERRFVTSAVSTRQFDARMFNQQCGVAPDRTKHFSATAQLDRPTIPVGQASFAHLQVLNSNNFVGAREFRDQGKSQKFLDRDNPPLTVDEVRELLNKNK